MHWGRKIVLVFGVFVGGILFLVFKSASQEMDLVTPDYYEKELRYQEVIDASDRTRLLTKPEVCKVVQQSIEIHFPEEMSEQRLKGQVWLYCVADKKRDMRQEFSTDSGLVLLQTHAGKT